MKSFRDMAKTSASKKMKMYGAKDNEVSSHIDNAQKYGAGGCIKKADGGSVGSQDLDEMDGGMGKPRMDRGGSKKASTTVNIIVGKSGPDTGAMPPPSMPMGGPPPMPAGPAPMPPMRASGGRVGKADGGSVSDREKALGGAGAVATGVGAAKLVHEMTKPSWARSGRGKLIGAGLTGLGLTMGAKSMQGKKEAGSEMAEDGKEDRRAKGGRVHLTGGADSGIGRLEKNHKK